MAVIFPPRIPDQTKSPGEREIFHRFREEAGTEGWIVLHSLDITNHKTQLFGELDFVVIVPNQGILCLEVKGCYSLRRKDGLWFYGANPKPDTRGPFRQASEAMHSIRNYLAQRDKHLNRLLFWSAVIFPFIDVTIESNEWYPWQLIDSKKYRNSTLSELVIAVLNCAHSLIANQSQSIWYQPGSSRPSAAETKRVANFLRPQFEFFETPRTRANRRDEEIKYYTEEQFIALDAMESNKQVIFTGPAGTGKTLLALEAARRGAINSNRVLLLCFNHLLGSWLREQVKDLPQITSGTIHSHMLSVTGVEPPTNAGHIYWSTELPDITLSKLLDSADGTLCSYDLVIIDEAQDILATPYLDFLDLCLQGGLSNGRWMMFGDFEMQMIYSSLASDVLTILTKRLGQVPRYSLRTNCRNTPRIAETVHLLGQMDPGYKRVLRPDNYVEPKIYIYSTENQKRKLLAKSLEELLAEGFQDQEIVILTPQAGNTEIPALLGASWDDRLTPLKQPIQRGLKQQGQIRHGTIHYFKGMEAPVVIVVGIKDVVSEHGMSLLYCGLSRALHRLVVLVSDEVRKELLKVLTQTIKGEQDG